MKTAIELEAFSRTGAGKGVARALRREGKLPAILYGEGKPATPIALKLHDLTLEYKKGAFKNKVVTLKIDGKPVQALPRDVQLHPVSDIIEHADFQLVTKDSTIHVFVPVKFLNMDKSVGLKRGGVLNIVRHDLELVCKPDQIPDHIEIDLLTADIGDSIHINDITLPKDVKSPIKRNFTIATIAGRKEEKEEAPVAAAGTTPAAGAAAPTADAAKADAKPAAKDKK